MMTTTCFPLGRVYITPGAQRICASLSREPVELLARHARGDWTEMSPGDQEANQEAIEGGDRIFSAYQVGRDRVFVITEADRSVTTILLAEEY